MLEFLYQPEIGAASAEVLLRRRTLPQRACNRLGIQLEPETLLQPIY